MISFGSLFAGIGGIDLGLERAGMRCRWQIEIEPFCRKILEKHWPEVPKYGDVRAIRGDELARVDLIAGGYPCQPFSQAGKRGGANDPRHLWPEFSRIVRILRPRFVLLENVPGHLSLGFGDVLGDLARLGYDTEWICLRASDFGAAHLRKRVFVVAYRDTLGTERIRRILGETQGGQQSERLRRERHGDAARHGCDPLAYRTPGGLGERRESPRRDGFSDGSDEKLENSARDEQPGLSRESGGMRRRGVCAAGEPLDIATEPRCGGGESGESGTLRDGARRPEPDGRCDAVADARLSIGRVTDAQRGSDGSGPRPSGNPRRTNALVADPGDGQLSQPGRGPEGRAGPRSAGADVSDASGTGPPNAQETRLSGPERLDEGRATSELCGAFAPGPADARWPDILRERPDLAPALESPLRGVVDGVPAGMDGNPLADRTKRLRALGNAVVPQLTEWIGERIMQFDSDFRQKGEQ